MGSAKEGLRIYEHLDEDSARSRILATSVLALVQAHSHDRPSTGSFRASRLQVGASRHFGRWRWFRKGAASASMTEATVNDDLIGDTTPGGREQSKATYDQNLGSDTEAIGSFDEESRKNMMPDGNNVCVRVVRRLPVGPTDARDAWLEYQWQGGGGLPVIVLLQPESKRVVAPLLLEETLLNASGVTSSEEILGYTVSGCGLLTTELEPGSHSATVRFLPTNGSTACEMCWDVAFRTQQRQWLWQGVTERMIGDAADNIASYLATPLLYTRRMTFAAPSASKALQEWIEFVWNEGGGLPVPTPILLNEGNARGEGRTRMIVPPFLKERIVSVDAKDFSVTYTVDNPGLFTYQVHSHRGRVRFHDIAEGKVSMVWEVEVRPFRGWREFVKTFTDCIVSTLSRNLEVRLAESEELDDNVEPLAADNPFGSIAEESWLGGVLAARQLDKRNTFDRTLSLVKPWTWGRATDKPGDFAEWSEASMPS